MKRYALALLLLLVASCGGSSGDAPSANCSGGICPPRCCYRVNDPNCCGY